MVGIALSKKMKIIIMSSVAFVLVIALILGIVLGSRSCASNGNLPEIVEPDVDEENQEIILDDKPVSNYTKLLSSVDKKDDDIKAALQNEYTYKYTNTTAVGYYAELKNEPCERVKPVAETKNEGATFASEEVNALFAGKQRYPSYGSTLKHVIGGSDAQKAARQALVNEACYFAAWGTRGANRGGAQTPDKYTKIDENGYLYQYKNNEWIHSLVKGTGLEEDGTTIKQEDYVAANYRQLYKHTVADTIYRDGATSNGVTYGVPDDAPGVVKEITMRSRGYSSYGLTGLYAPAGEVIKVEISNTDMNATGGVTIHIGQALYNGQANNIWVGKNQMQRFPILLTTLELNKSTCTYDAATNTWTGYIGSFVGGPIYIRNKGVTFTTKISGGLEYLHFILGYTTPEEFTRIKTTSKVPYFDLEVWNYGVLHSGPRYYAEGFSYDNLYNAAILWEKVSSVTTTNGRKSGIVFIYDAFVAAGAAVAFPGRDSVNCPLGWMSQSLNYNTIVSSGSWGNFHEYHHNYQNYGLGSGADGEVTNNGLNLVSYALFTKISSKRGIGTYGASGLGGWNNYTSATWALQRVKNGQITSTNGLAIYATLLHNFGADAYIRARGASGKNNYLNKWATVTHNDFSYYASLIDSINKYGGGTYSPSEAVKNANYPMFVPVSCVYQTGRSYMYDGEKKYSKTMRPYIIANAPFTIDLSPYSAPEGQYAGGSIVIPDGFTYKVKSITKPVRGTIEITDDFNVKYTPAADAKTGSTSGQIVVTLEITKDDGAFKVDDVDLILEFEISQEVNKLTLERTTYTYTDETMYSDAVEAYNANFAGSAESVTQNQSNPTQNANTDIWFYPNTEDYHKKYPNAPDKYFFHENTVEVIDGKLYFDDDGIYRVYLRGRNNCALYYSPDGKNYSLGARITANTNVEVVNKKANTAAFRPSAAETYFDVKFDEGKVYIKSGAAEDFPEKEVYTIKVNENNEIENWLYIKEVLIVNPADRSFIGVGMRAWNEAMFTIEETYHAADNTVVESTEDEAYAYTKTTYKDYQANEVGYTRRNKDSDTIQYFKKSGSSYVAITEKEFSDLTEPMSYAPTVANINGSQPYVNAYRSSYDFPNNSGFVSDYFYIRDYNCSYTADPEVVTNGVTQTYIDGNYVPWSNTDEYKIENLFDGNPSTYIHSGQSNANKVSASNPAVFTVQLSSEITASHFRLYPSTFSSNHKSAFPKNINIQGSIDGETYFDMGTYTGKSAPSSGYLELPLAKTFTFKYYKLTVTATNSGTQRLALADIQFVNIFTLTGTSNHITPDNDMLLFSGSWKAEQGPASFGRFYHGKSGDKVYFNFTGTYLAVLTANLHDSSFEVWIDGQKVDSIEVKPSTGGSGMNYISQKLSEDTHKVEIRCTGDTWIDSFAIFNQ